MTPLHFYKLQGAGNDFVLLDTLTQSLSARHWGLLARRLCDRRFGVGADGLLLVEPSQHADYHMRLYNADGSEATMCGNGIRCFARYLWEYHSPDATSLAIETGAGVRQVHRVSAERFRVAMGQPRVLEAPSLDALFAPCDTDAPHGIHAIASVDTGAPHLVLFVESVDAFPLERVGARLERHPLFPDRVNVSVAQVVSPETVRARVWERGVGATLACGTGACAIGVAGALAGTIGRTVRVQMPGGTLEVEWLADDALWLTGDAELVFEGVWRSSL